MHLPLRCRARGWRRLSAPALPAARARAPPEIELALEGAAGQGDGLRGSHGARRVPPDGGGGDGVRGICRAHLLRRAPSASPRVDGRSNAPIRMLDQLPLRWLAAGIAEPNASSHAGVAMRGEFYAFQIALYAPVSAIRVLPEWGALLGPAGTTAPRASSSLVDAASPLVDAASPVGDAASPLPSRDARRCSARSTPVSLTRCRSAAGALAASLHQSTQRLGAGDERARRPHERRAAPVVWPRRPKRRDTRHLPWSREARRAHGRLRGGGGGGDGCISAEHRAARRFGALAPFAAAMARLECWRRRGRAPRPASDGDGHAGGRRQWGRASQPRGRLAAGESRLLHGCYSTVT